MAGIASLPPPSAPLLQINLRFQTGLKISGQARGLTFAMPGTQPCYLCGRVTSRVNVSVNLLNNEVWN